MARMVTQMIGYRFKKSYGIVTNRNARSLRATVGLSGVK